MTLPSSDIIVLRDAIRQWIGTLAKNDYDRAAALLKAVPGVGVDYDAATIRSAIGRYSPDYREASVNEREKFLPTVTDVLEMADRSGENMVIYYTGDSELPTVDYDLPLDEEWSDLTAQFRILSVEGGYSLGLQDIRVL